MSGKGHHKHSHDLPQEIFVAKVFWFTIAGFFALKLFLAMNAYGLLSGRIFEDGGPALFGQAIMQVWSGSIGPIFWVLNILCALIALYAIIKVWPIRPIVTIFSNPHAHGHGGHGGGGHAAPHATEPAHAPANPVILKHWTAIVHRANTGSPENLRWAVLEADSLVDLALKELRLPGETMADRLANFRSEQIKSLDKLWDAHRLRNELAHTPGFKLSAKQAEKALIAFRDFLKEIKAF
jgi:hypothetical protein